MTYQPPATLESFVSSYWPDCTANNEIELLPLSGDAGFRRYYRTASAPSAIAVDSPPSKERNLEYIRMNLLLQSLGVRVPKVHAVDFFQGHFLLEDLGRELLQDKLAEGNPDDLYQQAMEQLDLIQSLENPPAHFCEYDQSMLLIEMQLFRDWFLQELLGISLTPATQSTLDTLFDLLAKEALSQPKVLVHRDFHARNLMCLGSGELAVIDFQDAVWGPITYDLVSLARDCYVRWSPVRVSKFVENAAAHLRNNGLIDEGQSQQFGRWFDWMGLQRHIKVLGLFARLHLRDGKPGYLSDLPLVLRYTLEVMGQYGEFSTLRNWMLTEVIPLCEQQPWYSDWQLAGSADEIA